MLQHLIKEGTNYFTIRVNLKSLLLIIIVEPSIISITKGYTKVPLTIAVLIGLANITVGSKLATATLHEYYSLCFMMMNEVAHLFVFEKINFGKNIALK